MAVGLQVEINVTGAISVGLSWTLSCEAGPSASGRQRFGLSNGLTAKGWLTLFFLSTVTLACLSHSQCAKGRQMDCPPSTEIIE